MNKKETGKKKETGVYTYIRMPQNKHEKSLSLNDYREFVESYANNNGMVVKREYVDNGGSGFSTENRPAFKQMLEDVSDKKDDVSFVLVYKLAHFSRNLDDIYSAAKLMKENNVFLVIAKDDIDTSLHDDRPVIAVLEALAGKA